VVVLGAGEATMSHTYGSNYTIVPAHGIVTRARVDTAPHEVRQLYTCQWFDDAVAIHRRCSRSLDEGDRWEPVGVILFTPMPVQEGVLRIYALEVSEGSTRADVERHIPMLFGL